MNIPIITITTGTTTAEIIHLKFDKENLSFSYDELKRTPFIFIEPTGERFSFQLNLDSY